MLDSLLESGQLKLEAMESGSVVERFKRGLNAIRRKPARAAGIPGWMHDPYDPTIQTPFMRNVAEDELYDAQFVDHSLSRVRAMLRQVQPSMRIAADVKKAPPYAYP